MKPYVTANYSPWEWEQFKAVDPILSTMVVQEQLALLAQTEGPEVSIVQVPSPTATLLPTDMMTNVAVIPETPVVILTATDQEAETPSQSVTPVSSPTITSTTTLTPTRTGSSTRTVTPTLKATATATSTPTASLTRTATDEWTSTPTVTRVVVANSTATPTQTPTLIPAPAAAFQPYPATGLAPLGVTFTNTSTGIITSYSWSFGDGSGLNPEINPYHVFTAPGTYYVQLTVYGPGGTDSADGLITVLPPPTSTYTPAPPVPTATATPTNTPIPPTATLTATNTATPTNTPIPPRADLVVGQTVNDTTPNVGDTITFTVTVTNNGPNNTSGVRLRNTVQSGLAITGSSPSQGNYAGGVWAVGPLANGATAILMLTARVGAGTGGRTLVSTTTITASNVTDPVGGNNTASASVTVQMPALSADLSLSKIVSNAAPNEGELISFTVTVTNNGPNTATGVRVTDSAQAGLTITGSTPSQGGYGGGVWTVGTLANGASATLTLTTRVGAGTGGSTLTNTATITASNVTDPVGGNNTASASVTVQMPALSADLSLSKIVNNLTPNELGNVTFTITISNNGPNAANSVQVADVIQSGLTITGSTPSQGSFVGGVWTVGALANGASATLDLSVQVDAGTSGRTLTNTATITASSVTDPVGGNNTASASVIVQVAPQNADLSISKTVNIPNPRELDNVIFTIVVANNGPDVANGVQVTDSAQIGLTITGSTPSQGSYAGGVWTVGTLANGATATLSLTVRVELGTGGTMLTNTANITASSVTDPVGGNNAGSASVTVQMPLLGADLVVSKTVNNPTPNELDNVTFTITVSNNGPNTTNGVQIDDITQFGLTITGNSPSQGSFVGGVWTVGTLTNGATATLDLYVRVDAGTGGRTLTNTANMITSSEIDPIVANNLASASVTVQVPLSADLSINKTVNIPNPQELETVTFRITVTNNGPSSTNGVLIGDITQAGLTITGSAPSQGSYAGGAWTVGTLANGATASLDLYVQVDAGTSGSTLTNFAGIITSSLPDPDASDDTSFASVTVQSIGTNPPVANDDTTLTAAATPVTIDVLANDTDPDGNINPATVVIISGPAGGSIQSINPVTGAITYLPNAGYVGIDLFEYRVCDTTGLCDNAYVRPNVAAGEVIIIDNTDSSRVSTTGPWDSSNTLTGYWASDYQQDRNPGQGNKSATFTPNLVGGNYEVYMWWPAAAQNASNVVVEIHFNGGTTTVSVNQRINGGQWNPLGVLQFAPGTSGYVVIRASGNDGYVIADAVRFVKVG